MIATGADSIVVARVDDDDDKAAGAAAPPPKRREAIDPPGFRIPSGHGNRLDVIAAAAPSGSNNRRDGLKRHHSFDQAEIPRGSEPPEQRWSSNVRLMSVSDHAGIIVQRRISRTKSAPTDGGSPNGLHQTVVKRTRSKRRLQRTTKCATSTSASTAAKQESITPTSLSADSIENDNSNQQPKVESMEAKDLPDTAVAERRNQATVVPSFHKDESSSHHHETIQVVESTPSVATANVDVTEPSFHEVAISSNHQEGVSRDNHSGKESVPVQPTLDVAIEEPVSNTLPETGDKLTSEASLHGVEHESMGSSNQQEGSVPSIQPTTAINTPNPENATSPENRSDVTKENAASVPHVQEPSQEKESRNHLPVSMKNNSAESHSQVDESVSQFVSGTKTVEGESTVEQQPIEKSPSTGHDVEEKALEVANQEVATDVQPVQQKETPFPEISESETTAEASGPSDCEAADENEGPATGSGHELRDIPLEPRPLSSRVQFFDTLATSSYHHVRSQEKDGLGSGSCHKNDIGSPRRERRRLSISRGYSTACLIRPEAAKAPPSPVRRATPSKMSTKIRQSVKALEFSFMLTVDDMTKLLDDLHIQIKGNTAKQTEFGTDRGITAFMKVVKKYEDNGVVLVPCFLVMADLAEVEINRDQLALKGCIEIVLIAMLKFHDNLMIQERGCYALASLAGTQKYQEWIVASNGIEVIMTTQAAFKSNVKIQAACLCALHNLAKDNKENAFSIAARGGIKALMEIVKRPEHNLELDFHKEACAAMATLARTNDSNRGAIAAAGGIETTMAAMRTWPENADLLAVAFDTLHTLSVGHSQNCNSIVADKGVEFLIEAIKTHESSERVQEMALLFAKLLTESAQNSTKFGSVGGVKLVLEAMRNFGECTTIQEEGCSIMCNMSMQQENKGVICSSGGIGMIVMAMKQLSDNFFVQKNGCNALLSLATDDESKKLIASGGGISAMLLAMRMHRDVPALQGLAVGALRKLATISRNRNIMKMNNGIETVERSMKNNPHLTYLQKNGEALLLLLDASRKKKDDEES